MTALNDHAVRALVAAGAVSLADGVRLVHLRGTLMQEAVPVGIGAMSAIVGMNMEEVVEFCKEEAHGEVCEAANINSQEQIVISGHKGVFFVTNFANCRAAFNMNPTNLS